MMILSAKFLDYMSQRGGFALLWVSTMVTRSHTNPLPTVFRSRANERQSRNWPAVFFTSHDVFQLRFALCRQNG